MNHFQLTSLARIEPNTTRSRFQKDIGSTVRFEDVSLARKSFVGLLSTFNNSTQVDFEIVARARTVDKKTKKAILRSHIE